MTGFVRELELHYEDSRIGAESWVHKATCVESAEMALEFRTAWEKPHPHYEYRNFRLYEYTSEHGLREIPIPESGGESC